MYKRVISYICLIMILTESGPIHALSDITNEVITQKTIEQSEEIKEANEQNDATTENDATSKEISTQTVESQQPQLCNEDSSTNTTIDHTTIEIVNNWSVEREDEDAIYIGKYLGEETNIVIPRTLKNKRVILNAQANTFPANVEHIEVAKAKNNEPEVFVNVWPAIESFKYKVHLKSADLRGLDVSGVASMLNLFTGCTSLEELDITGWNTGSVQIMQNTFSGCVKLKKIKGIEDLDMSKVFAMPHMFYDCSSLTTLDLSKWNVQASNGMTNLFHNCSSLESINLSNWNMPSATTVLGIFSECSKLKKIDISGWKAPLLTNLESMFRNCSSLTSSSNIIGLDNLNKSNVTNMKYMFKGCSSLTQVDTEHLIPKQIVDAEQMFYGCTSLTNMSMHDWKVKNMGEMFRDCNHLTTVNLTRFNIETATNITNMFRDCNKLTSINVSNWTMPNVSFNMNDMFRGCSVLTTIRGIEDWNLSHATNMSSMFMDCSNLTTIDTSNWRMPEITSSIREMFRGCRLLTTITGIEKWNTSQINNMENLFYECQRIETLDISKWDTSKVNNMRHMFYSCTNLQDLKLGELETQEVTDMRGMFKECRNLRTVTINELNAPNLTTIEEMFYNCRNLTDLTINKFNAPKLTNINNSFKYLSNLINLNINEFSAPEVRSGMAYMFMGLSSLQQVNLKGWNISKVGSIRQMFKDCSELVTIDVSNWNMDSVNDMQGVFNNCPKLTEITGLNSWNTSNVTEMGWMFSECENLQSIDVSSWNTSKVNNMIQMFKNCQMITKLDTSSWNTSNVTNMQGLFNNCKRLTEIKGLNRWNTSNVTDMGWMFAGADKLNFIDLRSFDLTRVNNTTEMFRVDKRVSNRTVLVLANDDKLVNYDYSKDNRVGSKLTFNSKDGFFNEATNDTTRFSKERFVVKPVEGKSLIQVAQSLVDEDIQKMDKPGKSGYTFNRWVLREENQEPQIKTSEESNQKEEITPEKIDQIFKKLNGVYEATWDSCAISVTVPTTIPFQVVTNLRNEKAEPFISGVLSIKNNNPKRAVKVSVQSFSKDDTNTQNSKIPELELLGPEECSWDTLSGKDSITKMALGMYVKSGIVGRTQYIKENPLWLKPDKVNDVPIGIIPNAESTDNPYECELSFVSKHAKDFIGGRSKAKFNLVFKFE